MKKAFLDPITDSVLVATGIIFVLGFFVPEKKEDIKPIKKIEINVTKEIK